VCLSVRVLSTLIAREGSIIGIQLYSTPCVHIFVTKTCIVISNTCLIRRIGNTYLILDQKNSDFFGKWGPSSNSLIYQALSI